MSPELLTENQVAPPARKSESPPPAAAPPEAPKEHSRVGFQAWLGRAMPTFLVLLALAGLGYWGHVTGWKLPKFSELNGTADAGEDDWCDEHSVPESICVECNPSLLAKVKDYGWCKKHGIHNCTLDHPDAAQLAVTPEVTQADLDRAERALALTDRPENNSKCPLYRRRIQFASEQAVAKAGVDIAIVEQRPMVEAITAPGEITYDQTRVVPVSTPVAGIVWRVEKAVGDTVKKGDLLALVNAAEVGKSKGEYLQALGQFHQKTKELETVEHLIDKKVYVAGSLQQLQAQAALREAEFRLVSAEQALMNLGLEVPSDEFKKLLAKGASAEEVSKRLQFLGLQGEASLTITTSNLLPIKASHEGVVVSRDVNVGQVVDSTKTMFTIADASQVWLMLNVRQEDAKYLALGQSVRFYMALGRPVRFMADGSNASATGKIAWISPAVDERTRAVKVRVDLANPEGRLRASAFGTGQIVLREEPNAVALPTEAVHWDGSCFVVFVRDKNYNPGKDDGFKVFHTRTVRVGAKDDQDKATEIIAGVLPNEIVASKGSDVLRAELLKNNLGAG